MVESIFKVLLSELTTVRVVCNKCGTAIEVSLNALGRIDGTRCAPCGTNFPMNPPGELGRLGSLQRAIEAASASDLAYHVEFSLPIPRD
jgi:tRNA(Ile2) C34 agmatinyltransferase TiaS